MKSSFYYILTLLMIGMLTACRPDERLRKAEKLMDEQYDSAYIILKTIQPAELTSTADKALYALLYCQALDKNEIYTATDSLISIATDYFDKRDNEKAAYSWFYKSRIEGRNSESVVQANALLKAQSYAENTKNNKLLALIFFDKAVMYSNQLMYDSAVLYNRLAANSFRIVNDNYNYALCKLSEANMNILIFKLDKAKSICDSINQEKDYLDFDITLESYFYRTYGALYYSMNDFNKSIIYYKKTPDTQNESFDDNTKYLIAKSYININKNDSALIFLKSIRYLGEMAPDYYKLLKQIYESKGDYRNAAMCAEKAYTAIDSLYTKRIDQSFAGMEKKFNYQKLQIANSELKIKYFRAVVIILLFLLIISSGVAVIFIWRNRTKKKQLAIENELLLQQTMRAEKEEENSHLLEQQLSLQKIIFTNLDQYRSNALKRPEAIKEGFSPIKNEHFFTELFAAIDTSHQNFSQRLSQKFPSLNDTDILICCLLLAGFDTGMIASILEIKVESVTMRRHRLRKRLQLDNQDNLLDYLRQF